MALKELPNTGNYMKSFGKLIEDGTYKRGDLLPSENELCAAHHLTRPTVQKGAGYAGQ